MPGPQNPYPFRARPSTTQAEHRQETSDEYGYGKDRIEHQARETQDSIDYAPHTYELR